MSGPTVEDFVCVETATDPHFWADGSEVVFRWNRPGVPQVFTVEAVGGLPRQLTDSGGVTYGLAVRPVHSEVLVIGDDGGDEQFQLHLVHLESGVRRLLASQPQVIHNFGSWSSDGRLLSYSSNQRARQFFDIYVQEVDSGLEHLVYQHDGMNGAGVFAADARALLISRPNLDLPGDNNLFVLELTASGTAAGEPRLATPHQADAAHATEWRAVALWSDGTIWALSNEGRDFVGLARIDGKTGEREYLATYDWDIEGAVVSADRSRIALVINEDGYSRLAAYEVDLTRRLGAAVALPGPPGPGVISTLAWRPDGGQLLYAFEGPRHPSDIWLADLTPANGSTRPPDQPATEPVRRLSESAAGAIDLTQLPEPTLVRYQSFDGREIPAFFYRPPRLPEDERMPCLVLVHGGPEGQSRPSLWGHYSAPHYLLTQGVALLVPNVRGSTGYGKGYSHADDVERRPDAVQDLVSATSWLAATGEVDPERIGVMGGSYGGYMVLAAITSAPERWAVAIDLFGIADFETFLKFTGPWRRRHRAREYGDNPEFLRSISPIHRAAEIRTPLLVIQGDHDVRVPPEESQQIVDSVRQNEGIVDYVVYLQEGHGIQKLPHRLDMGERIVAFCREHLTVPERRS